MRHGFLLIDKPTGPTSHDAVQTVRRTLPEKSAGHIGTLDPGASGLLVLAVGAKALKVIEFFNGLTKEYEAEVTFGSISSTYDKDGVIETVEPKAGWTVPDEVQLRRAIEERFIGKISQVPPAHSAIHVDGTRAYELARKGIEVEMKARTVQIDRCDIISYTYPKAVLRVSCGSGTYIRSLAHDLGEMMRCGAYLSALRRTKVGSWDVSNAVAPEDVTWAHVLPLKEVLKDLPKLELDVSEMEDIRHGRTIKRTIEGETFAWFEDLPVAVLIPAGFNARPRKVL